MMETWNKRLSGNQLKLIAAVSMVLDHIGYLLGMRVSDTVSETSGMLWNLSLMLRCLGRMAFPIFCFLLCEGFFHTHGRKRYILRLALFALLSEAPFDRMLSGKVFNWRVQNVFFTLLLGFLMMWAFKWLEERAGESEIGGAGTVLIASQFAVTILFCGAASLIHSDYDYIGIILIAACYMFRRTPWRLCAVGFVWMGLSLGNLICLPGLALGFFVILLYNGKRGTWKGKYFFYLLYPVHMAVLAFIFNLGL